MFKIGKEQWITSLIANELVINNYDVKNKDVFIKPLLNNFDEIVILNQDDVCKFRNYIMIH